MFVENQPKLISRRQFGYCLGRHLGAASLATTVSACTGYAERFGSLMLSAVSDFQNQHYLAGFSLVADHAFRLPVSERAHGMAVNPSKRHEVTYFSRRPGNRLTLVDIREGREIVAIKSNQGRHFYGHGQFSLEGNWLYTSENDYEKGQGVIVVRDAKSLKVAHEFPSYGIGPHEIHMMPDGKTLVVANGGILTHPNWPRKKLNLNDMQSSLVYIDTQTGDLLGEYRLPDRKLSIRHIDVNMNGLVVLVTQYQAEKSSALPLVASHQGEANLTLFSQEPYPWSKLKNYCGSVCFAQETGLDKLAAITSPRGGELIVLDISQQRLVANFSISDVCGVAYSSVMKGFIVTTGSGRTILIDLSEFKDGVKSSIKLLPIAKVADTRWDNHLLIV